MAEATGTTGRAPLSGLTDRRTGLGSFGFMQATEIDARMLGMIVALAIVWLGFQIMSGGVFLTPRNLWNLSVQTSTVAIMATGMVLVIVSRNIDLSVGSLLGFIAMIMGALQTEILPVGLGLGYDYPLTWIIVLAAGLLLGAVLGALQGFVIAFLRRAGLHRDPRRPAGVARRRMVGGERPHAGAARFELPAYGRRR